MMRAALVRGAKGLRACLARSHVLHHAGVPCERRGIQPQHVGGGHGGVATPHIHLAICTASGITLGWLSR